MDTNRFYTLFLILFVVLLWAGNFISISFLVKEIDSYTALTLRFIAVSIILITYLLKIPSKKDFLYLLLATLFIVPGHFGLLFLSISKTKSLGGISVLIQLSIPFSILFSWIFYKDRPELLKILGLIISFFGIVLLLYEPSMFENKEAFLIAICSALFLGLYFIVVKKIKNISSIGIIAWSSFLGIPLMYIIMLLNGSSFAVLYNVSLNTTYYSFFYTVIAGSILGHGIWAYLIKTEDISFISPFLLLVPMVTVILSFLIFGEKVNIEFIFIASIIIFGIFLVFISTNKKLKKERNGYLK
ncbi:DMT family transporter [Halarcobacter anaerophilus]|uniref:DMT family transporter n=1 Tax=Halarcobacter anaerophilus TaxID=877500 RepID=UPI0005C9DC59|nr:EamA family transporter [Halarcobacter anaerophilus]